MTIETNEELLEQYKEAHDISIRNRIVEKNIPLVKYIVKKFYNDYFYEHEYNDLVNFGVFGLIRAVELYDNTKKIKFSTYAYRKIYYSIIDELRKIDYAPRGVRQKIRDFKKKLKYLEDTYGDSVDVVAAAKKYGLSSADINVMNGTFISFDNTALTTLSDYRGAYNDNVLCRYSLRASFIPQVV